MTKEEAKSCICTIKMLQKLAYNIHGVMDVVDADNCKKIIKALEQEPCEDCVNRHTVLNTLFYKSDNNCEVVLNKELQDRIKALPSVTPQPKTGYWINAYPDIEPNPMFMYGICSVCGFKQSISNKLNYCPNCGAKMEVEE